MRLKVLFLSVLFASATLIGSDSEKTTLRFSGVPAIGFGPDTGLGGGFIGSLYFDQDGYQPYKTAIGVKVFLTTKGIQSHYLQLDRLGIFDLPLRFIGRVGFYKTISETYCGKASDANCSDQNAASAATALRLSGTERDQFISSYYKHRFMSFYGDFSGRYLLWKDIAKLEFMMAYRGTYYKDGDFSENGPYLGSLYSKDFANQKSDGYLSSVELGLMLDKRDNEPAPTSGYWLEGSIRAGSKWILSSWDHFGANVSGRFYLPLDYAHRLVFASQTVADIILGDLPYDALSRIGGSQAIYGTTAFGGQTIGRGVTEQLYVGRIKFIEQLELRYLFWSFLLLNQNFDLTAAALTDIGMAAWDFSRFAKDLKHVYVGFGGGLRIYWDKTFVIRADLGVSPHENFSPKFYLTVGNVF